MTLFLKKPSKLTAPTRSFILAIDQQKSPLCTIHEKYKVKIIYLYFFKAFLDDACKQ